MKKIALIWLLSSACLADVTYTANSVGYIPSYAVSFQIGTSQATALPTVAPTPQIYNWWRSLSFATPEADPFNEQVAVTQIDTTNDILYVIRAQNGTIATDKGPSDFYQLAHTDLSSNTPTPTNTATGTNTPTATITNTPTITQIPWTGHDTNKTPSVTPTFYPPRDAVQPEGTDFADQHKNVDMIAGQDDSGLSRVLHTDNNGNLKILWPSSTSTWTNTATSTPTNTFTQTWTNTATSTPTVTATPTATQFVNDVGVNSKLASIATKQAQATDTPTNTFTITPTNTPNTTPASTPGTNYPAVYDPAVAYILNKIAQVISSTAATVVFPSAQPVSQVNPGSTTLTSSVTIASQPNALITPVSYIPTIAAIGVTQNTGAVAYAATPYIIDVGHRFTSSPITVNIAAAAITNFYAMSNIPFIPKNMCVSVYSLSGTATMSNVYAQANTSGTYISGGNGNLMLLSIPTIGATYQEECMGNNSGAATFSTGAPFPLGSIGWTSTGSNPTTVVYQWIFAR